jgi:hypothetical protein
MPSVKHTQNHRLSSTQRGLLILLVLCATVSTSIGVVNALHQSQDFQWSGERVLLAHVDPWARYLAGDPQHQFLQTQIPNYLPILYVLIVPLGLLPLFYAKLLWALANVAFAIVSAGAAGRAFELGRWRLLVLVCLMLMATPTRISIGNGQQGLLVLMLWCLTLLATRLTGRAALLSGIAYFKYSFAPPMALFLLFRRGGRAFALSLVPAMAGVAVVWFWITGGRDPMELLRLVLEPLAVSRNGFKADVNDPNLMNVVEQLLRGRPQAFVSGVEMVVALGICLFVSTFAFRRNPDGEIGLQVSVMAVMGYGLFKHHTYDAVVLLLPLAYAIARSQERAARVLIGLIGYLFFVERGLQAAHLPGAWLRLPDFLVVMTILALTYKMGAGMVYVEEELLLSAPARAQRSRSSVRAAA